MSKATADNNKQTRHRKYVFFMIPPFKSLELMTPALCLAHANR